MFFEGTEKELCCVYKNDEGKFINWLMGNYYKKSRQH